MDKKSLELLKEMVQDLEMENQEDDMEVGACALCCQSYSYVFFASTFWRKLQAFFPMLHREIP